MSTLSTTEGGPLGLPSSSDTPPSSSSQSTRPSRRYRCLIYGLLAATLCLAIAFALSFGVRKPTTAQVDESKAAIVEDPHTTSNNQAAVLPEGGTDTTIKQSQQEEKESDTAVASVADIPQLTFQQQQPKIPSSPSSSLSQGIFPSGATKGGSNSIIVNGKTQQLENALKLKSNKAGDPLQGAAAVLSSSSNSSSAVVAILLKQYIGGKNVGGDAGGSNSDTCWPQNALELTEAVENQQACQRIVLTNPARDAYVLAKEIIVTRHVIIVGHPRSLPTIDAGGGGAVRAFTVQTGGQLELQFLRIRQGVGILRDRVGLEGLDRPSKQYMQIAELRGGAVVFETGAQGGFFTGCIFIAAATQLSNVQSALMNTMNGVGGRIYGGHIFVAAGVVTFLNCHFWDSVILLPLTDQIVIGGDILVVAGEIIMTGCTFTVTLLFGNYGGAGFTIAILGGIGIFTFCFIQNQVIASTAAGAGQTIWVGGGVQIVTGFDFRLTAAVLNFIGMGDFTVGAGVLVCTGLTIENAYGILLALGAGFYLSIGAGAYIGTGVTYVQFNGPAYQSLAGGSVFCGTGSSINIGAPGAFFGSTMVFAGAGGFCYNGAGVSVWIGSPQTFAAATYAFYGVGGTTAHIAGMMIYLFSPVFSAVAVSYFAGLGGIMYVGAGGAVIGYSPSYLPTALSYSNGNPSNFYVQGNTNATGQGLAYVSKHYQLIKGKNSSNPQQRDLRALGGLPKSAWTFLDSGSDAPLSSASTQVAMFNMTLPNREVNTSDPTLRNKLSSWVPDKLFKVTEEIQNMKQQLSSRAGQSNRQRGRRKTRSRRVSSTSSSASSGQEGAVAISSSSPSHRQEEKKSTDASLLYVAQDIDYCATCNVDSVGGPGASSCQQSCEATAQEVPGLDDGSFSWDQIKFDSQHIVMTDLKLITPAETHIDPMDLRDILRRWITSEGFTDVTVSVYSTSPDELTSQWIPSPTDSNKTTEACSLTHHLKAVFIAHDQPTEDFLQKAVNEEDIDNSMPLFETIQVSFAKEDIQICAIDSSYERTIFVPAYFSKELLNKQSLTMNTGAYSVMLIDPTKAAVPISPGGGGSAGATPVVSHKVYWIQAAGFPPSTPLDFDLIGSQEVVDPVTNVKELKQSVFPISEAVMTDKIGRAKVLWTIPSASTLPQGDYYIKAVDQSGSIFGLSQVYTIGDSSSDSSSSDTKENGSRTRRRRKLGPIMEI